MHCNFWKATDTGACVPQLESPCATTTEPLHARLDRLQLEGLRAPTTEASMLWCLCATITEPTHHTESPRTANDPA